MDADLGRGWKFGMRGMEKFRNFVRQNDDSDASKYYNYNRQSNEIFRMKD